MVKKRGEHSPLLFLEGVFHMRQSKTERQIMIENEVSTYCKNFRTKKAKLTLRQIHEKTGVNIKTLSGFENGRSSNLFMINHYIVAYDFDKGLQLGFIQGMNKVLGRL